MTLASGTRLGSYEVLAPLGAGGMGEVYRARDTQLKRDVALKVLPAAVATDPERLARFQREAELLAALNHPHIAQIYGVAEADGVRALVMELVDGPTLAERIAQGPIPIGEALPIARQLAEALDEAHERGIVHRDLKPANIKVTPAGAVKVLDFGLAKALAAEASAEAAALSTMTSPAQTQAGIILGTAAYMSPEQARGRPVDKRADIWAFGVVLYEMLTGAKAFPGETITDVLGAVVKSEPDWTALPKDVPARVRELMQHCLQKDPRVRLRDIGDARTAVVPGTDKGDGTGASAVTSAGRWRSWPWVAVALAAALAVSVATNIRRGLPDQSDGPVHLSIAMPWGVTVNSTEYPTLAVSRDGQWIAYVTSHGLVLRSRTDYSERIVTAESVWGPFFSPDGQSLGFLTPSGLWTIPVGGDTPVNISSDWVFHAVWGDDDAIYFTVDVATGGLFSIPAVGGEKRLVAKPRAEHDEAFYFSPDVLPDGRLMFTAAGPGGGYAGAKLMTIDPRQQGSSPVVLLEEASFGRFVAPDTLVYVEGKSANVVARAFDPASRGFTGIPEVVAADVRVTHFGGVAQVAASYQGTLAYVPGSEFGKFVLVEQDSSGTTVRTLVTDGFPDWPTLDPTGKLLGYTSWNGRDAQVFQLGLAAPSPERLTFANAEQEGPVWSADGRRVIYSRQAPGGRREAVISSVDTPEVAEVAFVQDGHFHVHGWSQDGWVIYNLWTAGSSSLFAVNLQQPDSPRLVSESSESGSLSADGRWLAFCTITRDGPRVQVVSFPDLGRRSEVPGPACFPKISPDGAELYALKSNRWSEQTKMLRFTRAVGSGAWSQPAEAFDAEVSVFAIDWQTRRFFMIDTNPARVAREIRVMTGWRLGGVEDGSR